ncbi:ExeM/NucH family extracellular endonuclease [Agreia sp. PsM10]|uniref:ExeM/NucH family extracellular endonuclease n=1 Tax=Agreia sp. PsM10 TaxID=3030533 RepID=UPI00263B5948|nr:ExeM/NucH family extracellular endonuclease [Agreia sp. PsM10]MDN4641775.1 ExeM/NucH family extracellular endonuclease [Agreia sp. PsM10]
MPRIHPRRFRLGIAALAGAALAASPLLAVPAFAASTGVVINEAYVNGGSVGATYLNKFVELYNPTDTAVDLSSMSLQYRSAGGSANPSGVLPLTGSIAAGGHYLIQGGSNAGNGAALPTPDAVMSESFAAGAGGTLFLSNQTGLLIAPPTGSLVNDPAIVDLLGYGTSNTFEGSAAARPSVTTSMTRTTPVDTDVNSDDFALAAPTPQNTGGEVPPEEPEEPSGPAVEATIAEIQGTTDTSPLAGETVVTRGVVTASYPTGGFNGYVIQTPGTGGSLDLATHTASDGLFVFSSATVPQATIGAYVEVTGVVSEYQGLTELTVASDGLTALTDAVTPPAPAAVALPSDPAQRESLESMLLAPAGDYTVTDNYDTNYYGSIVLTAGAEPLVTPTSVTEPGSAEYTALVAANAAAAVTLDDGASTNFNSAANKSKPLPYLTVESPVRIGAAVTFTGPVVVDYRFGAWSLQPTQELTPANAATVQPATFENTRTPEPLDVGGDATVASFNVLNYFSTTGDELAGCTYYTDRDGDPVTVNSGCDARGAAEQEDLDRQQAKIVSAINALDADVVSLEEIENSSRFGLDRDASLAELTDTLNAAAGAGTWAFVPSPEAVPAGEDVIRTAFIYRAAVVETVGDSVIDDDTAFSNARYPLAQAFQLIDGGESTRFLTIVNHFKSKGSGTGEDADQNDGQGASNASRVRQATALVEFADGLVTDTGIDRVLLSGDFNSYEKEDPIDVILAAGYTDLGEATGKKSYAFDGAVGSLDHVFASQAAAADVTGTDIWNINSVESIALEYSRYNYNAVDLYSADPYRSSDHDPVVVGLALREDAPVDPGTGLPGTGAPGAGVPAPGAVAGSAGSGRLAATGTEAAPVLFGALALLVLGGGMALRRRRSA